MHRRNIALIVAIILLAGCGAPRDHGTVVVGLEGNPSTLDPRFAVDAYATRILPLLFERLLDTGPDGDVRPALAVSWAVDEDARRYTFHLRGDARFSDGTPLTARDAAATLNHLRDPANKCPAGAGLDAVASVEAPDDTTLVVTLAQPYAPLLLKMVRPVMPAASLDDADFGDYPVGGGPYRLERYERGRAIDLVRNEHYAGPAPAIERVRFEVLPNETTRMLKMRKGEIDLLLNATPPYALKHFERLPGIVVERAPGINFSYLGFNLRDERGIVSRIEVRRAIAHAIDRKRIIDTLLAGQARAADGLLAPENWAHADDLSVFDYDPAKARALLDEVFPDPDGDGPAPRFTLSFKTSTDRLRNRIAEVIARQLAETGIALKNGRSSGGPFSTTSRKEIFKRFRSHGSA
ncbi:MAG: ABC transporter substrate-binding protein [Deltaproteobacteria bacterium]|nr:ABC transporter substrate-binding protein [Deltaproteobacteria bacterium]